MPKPRQFFDDYQDLGGGGKFLSKDEKDFLIENGIAFEITAVGYDPDNQYGPRYVAFCNVPHPEEEGEIEEKKISFPTETGVDSRDAMLKAMKDYLTGEDAEPVKVKLEKPGRAILISQAG